MLSGEGALALRKRTSHFDASALRSRECMPGGQPPAHVARRAARRLAGSHDRRARVPRSVTMAADRPPPRASRFERHERCSGDAHEKLPRVGRLLGGAERRAVCVRRRERREHQPRDAGRRERRARHRSHIQRARRRGRWNVDGGVRSFKAASRGVHRRGRGSMRGARAVVELRGLDVWRRAVLDVQGKRDLQVRWRPASSRRLRVGLRRRPAGHR